MQENAIKIPGERIENVILLVRGQKVIIGADLAILYDVPTKALNQAVKRNTKRFPADFMFQLTPQEKNELVTICDRFQRLKHSSVLPRAFTEQGVAMLSTVLNSNRAIEVNIEVMRAFVRLRQMLLTNKDLSRRLDESEKKYDARFRVVFEAIRELMKPPKLPDVPNKKTGFTLKEKQSGYSRRRVKEKQA